MRSKKWWRIGKWNSIVCMNDMFEGWCGLTCIWNHTWFEWVVHCGIVHCQVSVASRKQEKELVCSMRSAIMKTTEHLRSNQISHYRKGNCNKHCHKCTETRIQEKAWKAKKMSEKKNMEELEMKPWQRSVDHIQRNVSIVCMNDMFEGCCGLTSICNHTWLR